MYEDDRLVQSLTQSMVSKLHYMVRVTTPYSHADTCLHTVQVTAARTNQRSRFRPHDPIIVCDYLEFELSFHVSMHVS